MTLYDGYIKIKKGKQKTNKMKEEKGGKLRRRLSRTYKLLPTTHQRAKIGAK
jgi:hypothetical protein